MSVTRRRFLTRSGGVSGVLLAGPLAGCTEEADETQNRTTIRIGSKSFPEQELLGYLAYERLRALDGVQLVDRIGYGDSERNWNGTKAGRIDLYWEYTGTAWSRLPPARDEHVNDPEELYTRVAADADEQGITMGDPAAFSNEFVLAADRSWSERTGVKTIGDLAAHIGNGESGFGIALNEAFYHRRDGWYGLTEQYGIGTELESYLNEFVVTSIGLTYELLESGKVDVINGFATDPQLDRQAVVELDDDRDYFLPYQPAPTVYAPTAEGNPQIFEVLSPLASSLDKATMRRLNREVFLNGQSPREVARAYLRGIEG